METQTQRDDLRVRVDQLRTLRDEVRVRLHLAGLDVKAMYDKLSPKLDELERQLARGGDVAIEEMTRALDALKKALRELHEKLRPMEGR